MIEPDDILIPELVERIENATSLWGLEDRMTTARLTYNHRRDLRRPIPPEEWNKVLEAYADRLVHFAEMARPPREQSLAEAMQGFVQGVKQVAREMGFKPKAERLDEQYGWNFLYHIAKWVRVIMDAVANPIIGGWERGRLWRDEQ